jgi:TonB family protein
MFDFVISRNQQRRSAKRIFASWMASCLMHFIALFLLIEYPELLRRPDHWHFRILWQLPTKDESQKWRTVTVLPSKMTMPSDETLRKLLSDSGKKGPGAKPIPIHTNNLQAVVSDRHAKPIVQPQVSFPSRPPANESSSPVSVSSKPGTGSPESLAGNQNVGDSGKQGTAKLPPSVSDPKPAIDSMTVAPAKTPNSIVTSPEIPQTSANNKRNTPEGGGKAISSSGIIPDSEGKGFPMGEYTNQIVELLKEKWFIPSYLKDSQGHTTVVFTIDKNGRTMNVRILTGSGSNSLDIAALNAVLSCNNLPALPKGYPGDHVGVRFVFSYNEH